MMRRYSSGGGVVVPGVQWMVVTCSGVGQVWSRGKVSYGLVPSQVDESCAIWQGDRAWPGRVC